jgi:hypothetical protein
MEHDLDRLMWRFFEDIPAVPQSVDPFGSVLVGGPRFVSNWPTHDLFQVYDDPWGILTISSV